MHINHISEVAGNGLDSALDQRRYRLIQITNASIFLTVSIFVIYRLTTLGFTHPPVPAMLVLALTAANLIYVKLGGSLDRSAWTSIVVLLFGLGLAGWNSGAFVGPTVLMSPLLPLLAMLLISSTAGWLVSGLTMALLSGLYIAEANAYVKVNPNSEEALLTVRYLAIIATVSVSSLVVWEFSRLKQKMLEINRLQAVTDHLTGLSNRRYFEEALQREHARAQRTDSSLSLIMADVDHFKRYNDANGHQAGDRCLIEVAKVFTEAAKRPADVICRFGGEEFVVLLPDTDLEGASQVAEAIRLLMQRRKMPYEADGEETVTLTLGVASARGPLLNNSDQLIGEADQALYRGKNTGRNKVVSVAVTIATPKGQSAPTRGNVIPFSA